MKKTSTLLFGISFLLGILLTSCGAQELNSNAEKTATAFYNDLQKKDYAAALALCSNKAFSKDTQEDWTKAFQRNAGLLGELKSFKKTSGFNVQTSTSVGTTVITIYDVEWQYGKSQDSVVLIKEKDGGMKLYRYTWQHSKAKYLEEVAASEKVASKYMDAVKTGNYDAAIALLSEEALKATPKDNWASFLNKAVDQLGNISAYNILKDSSSYNIAATGNAGKGNYYDIFVQTQRGDNKVKEKVVFFQKNYEEPLKLLGHFFL
ncbi:MAG: hypothetical protein ABIN67_03700 [Ferruginibacter sp.]